MGALILDIETVRRENIDPALLDKIRKRCAENERDFETELATSPFTATVAAIGMVKLGAIEADDVTRVILAAETTETDGP